MENNGNIFNNFELLIPESKENSLEYMAHIETVSNKNKFLKFLNARKDQPIIDVAIQYCDMFGVDIESVADFIKGNNVLLLKIRIEAENINMVEKLDRLPV